VAAIDPVFMLSVVDNAELMPFGEVIRERLRHAIEVVWARTGTS